MSGRSGIRIERAGQGAFPLAQLREGRPPPVPWLRIVLAAVLGISILVGAGLGLIRLLIDTEALSEEAQAALRQATGREVTITGPLVIDSIAKATVALENVVIPTRAGFDGPPLARIGRLEAELSRSSLLTGRTVIKRLVIADPEIHLAIDADGVPNWRNPPAAPGTRPTAAPAHAMPRSFHLKDGRLTLADARAGRATNLVLRRITLTEAEGGGLMSLSADLGYGTQRVAANGQVGPLPRLLDTTATTPWPLRVALESQGAKLTVAGGIQRPLELSGYAVKIDAWVGDTSTLVGLLPYRLPAMRTVSLTARIADGTGSVPDISGARLQMGASDFSAWVPGLKVDTADIAMPGLEQALRGEVLGTLNGVPVKLRGALGGLSAFLPENAGEARFFPIDIEAEAGATRLALKGGVAAPGKRSGLDLAVTARVADLELLSPLVGQRLPRLRNVSLEARLADGAADGFAERVALRSVAIVTPHGDLGGDFVLHLSPRTGLSGTLRSTKLDADELGEVLADAFGALELADRPSPFRRQGWDDARVIPNRRLHFETLRQADADLTLALGELVAAGATWRNVAGRVLLEGGRLVADPLVADLPNGQASVRLAIDASAPRVPMRLRAAIPGIPVQPLLASPTRRDNLFGDLEIDADLSAEGESVRAITDSLTGRLGLAIVEGNIDSRLLLDPLSGVMGAARVPMNLTTLAGTLARLRCFAARVDAERGKVTVSGLVLESGRVTIQGDGTIDLKAEELALRLQSSIRMVGQGVTVPSKLEGSFRVPRMELESQEPARARAEAAMPDTCHAVLEQARAGRVGAMPEGRNARPDLVAPPQRRR
jgi:AsmA protein